MRAELEGEGCVRGLERAVRPGELQELLGEADVDAAWTFAQSGARGGAGGFGGRLLRHVVWLIAMGKGIAAQARRSARQIRG